MANIGNLQSNSVSKTWLPPNQPPVAQCQDVTVAAGAQCQGDASINNGSFDPDNDPIMLIQTPPGQAPLASYGLGQTSVTLTVTDDEAASSMCTATVTVVDQTPPSVACPAPQTVECASPSGASVSVNATATDNCSVGPVSCAPGSGTFPIGSTSVSCAAADGSGNTGSCSTTVNVVDTTPPAITCPAPQVVECTSPAGASATVTASATDLCGPATASCPASGSTFPIWTTPVSCSASDNYGNSSSCGSSVQVVDTTKPTVSCVESVNPSGSNIPRASKTNEDGFYKVSASDLCTAAPTITIGSSTLANGETIKITQTPGKSGVRLVNVMGPLQIKHFQVGPGDAVITATDGSGNQTSVTCLVPPPPK